MKKLLFLSFIFASFLLITGCSNKNNSSENKKEYVVTWKVDGNSYIEFYLEGEIPVYKFGTSKESDSLGEYIFTGWDKEITEVKSNVTYEALYDIDYYDYTYTWVIGDNSEVETYHYGDVPTYKGNLLENLNDGFNDYTFIKWDKDLTPVTSDQVITAVLESEYISYDISFDIEGEIIKEQYYYGSIPVYDKTPIKQSTSEYFYEFVGWENVENGEIYQILPEVTKEAKYKAVFNEVKKWTGVKLKLYKVDGTLIKEEIVSYNTGEFYSIDAPNVDGLTPSYKYVKGVVEENECVNIYYSEADIWDKETISSSLSGEGSKENPYLINSAADLAYLRKSVNSGVDYSSKYFKLLKSIDVNGYNFQLNYFSGNLDGNNCSIYGLNIINSSEKTGFIKELGKGGTISSLNIYGTVTGVKYTGGLVGYARGNISYCNNYATINSSGGNSGGLVGYATTESSFLKNCINYGKINGSVWNLGGIVGLTANNVSYCINYGNIDSTSDCAGGIAGTSQKSLIHCENYGDIYAKASAGGIAFNSSSIISDCTNYGDVFGKWNIGGIVAKSTYDVKNCINYGNATGTTEVGGIISVATGKVENCINNGTVIGTWGAGGIAGAAFVEVIDCTNNGTIEGVGQVGGIVGKSSCIIDKCTNYGNINGTSTTSGDQLGGIAGIAYSTVKNSNNYGNIGGTTKFGKVGGIAGYMGKVDDGLTPYLTNCINYGKILTVSNDGIHGGVVGNILEGTVDSCINYGLVTGTKVNAGIVGKCWSGNDIITVSNCINYGEVNGTAFFAGGIFGTIDNAKVSNCINNGNVISTSDCVGGVGAAVYSQGEVIDSKNNGLIVATTNLAGLVYINQGTISNCYNYGTISLSKNDGVSNELVFKNDGTVTNCESGSNINCEHKFVIIRYDNSYHWYECECGARKPESLKSHTYSTFISNNDATCSQNETQSAYCDEGCGHIYTKEILDSKLSHEYNSLIFDDNYHWYECECGTINSETLDKHSGGTSDCTHKSICELCEQVYGDYAHKYSNLVSEKEATCEEDGNIDYYSCELCNKYFDKELNEIISPITQATGHSYDAGVLNDNIRLYTCLTCGQTKDVKVYTITWNDSGKTSTQVVDENTDVIYKGLNPYKVDSNNVYSYKFIGWSLTENGEIVDMSKEIADKDKTYYSVFKERQIIKELKVLMIGNSYSDDTVQWVHEIAESLDIEITIANLYIGSCTLSTHLSNLTNDSNAYEYVKYDKSSNSWSRISNTSIKDALKYEDWDYVSLQQASHESGLIDTYDDINSIIEKVLEIKSDVKFVWNMTWAYQQDSGHSQFGNYNNDQMTMYNGIISSVKEKVLTNSRIEHIIPNGTAIQNARTSSLGDNLCRDQYCHLTLDLGRYIAGLTLVSEITGIDVSNITYIPSGVSEEYRQIAIESVNNAIRNPFVVVNSEYVS